MHDSGYKWCQNHRCGGLLRQLARYCRFCWAKLRNHDEPDQSSDSAFTALFGLHFWCHNPGEQIEKLPPFPLRDFLSSSWRDLVHPNFSCWEEGSLLNIPTEATRSLVKEILLLHHQSGIPAELLCSSPRVRVLDIT